MHKKKPTAKKSFIQDITRPRYVVGLVFVILFTVSGLTTGIWLTQTSQDNRSLAAGGETIAGCNQPCQANRDCEINLRCYYGACRLATNPTSSDCSFAPTQPIGDGNTQAITSTTNPTQPVNSISPTILVEPPTNELPHQGSENSAQLGMSQFLTTVGGWLNQFIGWLQFVFTSPQYRLPAIIFSFGLVLIVMALTIRTEKSQKVINLEKQNSKNKRVPQANNPITPHQTTNIKHSAHARLKQKQIQTPR